MTGNDEIERFIKRAADGAFIDNRPRVKDPSHADVERVRKNCPAEYPFSPAAERAEQTAVQILLAPGAYEKLLQAERGI
jgi:hypothetical protein